MSGSKDDGVVVSFEEARARRETQRVHDNWVGFYKAQEYDDLLDSLVYEHDHDFPLRTSSNPFDQARHKALIEVLNERAQTNFLKEFLAEIQATQNSKK